MHHGELKTGEQDIPTAAELRTRCQEVVGMQAVVPFRPERLSSPPPDGVSVGGRPQRYIIIADDGRTDRNRPGTNRRRVGASRCY